MYPTAAQKNDSVVWNVFEFTIRACLSRSGSASSDAPTIAEFLTIAIVIEPSGGMTVRNACGSTISRSVCALREAERERRLHLALAHREHAGAQRLGDVRRGVDAEARDPRRPRPDPDARAAQAGERDEQQHEQREVAEDLDVERAEPLQPAARRDPQGGDERPQHERDDEARQHQPGRDPEPRGELVEVLGEDVDHGRRPISSRRGPRRASAPAVTAARRCTCPSQLS